MFTDQTLILINIACIGFLLIMLIVLAAATRMKGGAGWVAVIIVTTTIPIYLSNLMRDVSSTDNILWILYPAYFLNTLCIPSLWFFVHSQFDKSFRFTCRSLLHAIPAMISLLFCIIYYTPMSAEEISAEMQFMENGGENLPTIINDLIITIQLFIYFPLMLRYVHRRKKYLKDNYADNDYVTVHWVHSFIVIFFGLFVVVMVAYIINPRTDIWLIPILNVIAMGYLVYSVIFHSTTPYINRLPDTSADECEQENTVSSPAMDTGQMKEICKKVLDYLTSSKAYTNPDFSLHTLTHETGIHHKNISIAINGYLQKNFFELVNGMRIEEAKHLLPKLSASNYTIESVYAKCGFRSRSTFFMTFKKIEGVSPAQWLKRIKTKD